MQHQLLTHRDMQDDVREHMQNMFRIKFYICVYVLLQLLPGPTPGALARRSRWWGLWSVACQAALATALWSQTLGLGGPAVEDDLFRVRSWSAR